PRRIGCATDNTFAQRLPARGTHQPRSCLLPGGDLLGQASGQSAPECGAFSVYSSYGPFSPKTRDLWTHIATGPKKWGQATSNASDLPTPRCCLASIRGASATG